MIPFFPRSEQLYESEADEGAFRNLHGEKSHGNQGFRRWRVHPWGRRWRREGDAEPGVGLGGHAGAAAPATRPRRRGHPHHHRARRRVTALPRSSRSGYAAVPIPHVLSRSILLCCNYCELRFCARGWLLQPSTVGGGRGRGRGWRVRHRAAAAGGEAGAATAVGVELGATKRN